MADSKTRRRRAHVAGTAAGAVAGAASAPFGAAKLRDSYRESYPARFERGLRRVEHVARREGMTQQQTSRALRLASHGKPGFVPLITATAAATAAGGARRYERHQERKVAKSAFGIEHPLQKADRRRAVEVGAGGGAVLAARGAQKSRRAARGHLVRAADLERDSNSSFHAARGQGAVVTQRLQRHVSSGPGSLPRTSGNLVNTGRAHLKQQAHLHNGLAARDASHAATAAGRTALGRSRGKLALAGGLVAVSGMASTRRHRY